MRDNRRKVNKLLQARPLIVRRVKYPMTPPEKIKNAIESVEQWFWSPAASGRNWPARVLTYTVRIGYAVLRDLRNGQLSMRAMSLVYTTVIAIVPLLALSFSVLKGFGLHNEVEPAMLEALADLGDKRYDIVENVMGFIDNVKVGVLGAVGFALLIYSVISMMHKIEHSFNYTWQIKRDRTMSQRFRDYLSVIFVAPVLIFLSAALTTSSNTQVVVNYIAALPFGADLVEFSSTLVPYLIMSMGFAFIYMFLPNTQVRFAPAFVGGAVTAVVWKIMGWGVATFVANSASNIAIYSAFASVIILMVWMYIGWLVLLVGASVAFYFQNPQYTMTRLDHTELCGADVEKLAINVLYRLGQRFGSDQAAPTVDELAAQLRVPAHVLEDIVDFLQSREFLVRADGGVQLYPQKPLAKILLRDVISSVREQSITGASLSGVVVDPPVGQMYSELRRALEQQLGDTSIEDLLETSPSQV